MCRCPGQRGVALCGNMAGEKALKEVERRTFCVRTRLLRIQKWTLKNQGPEKDGRGEERRHQAKVEGRLRGSSRSFSVRRRRSRSNRRSWNLKSSLKLCLSAARKKSSGRGCPKGYTAATRGPLLPPHTGSAPGVEPKPQRRGAFVWRCWQCRASLPQ